MSVSTLFGSVSPIACTACLGLLGVSALGLGILDLKRASLRLRVAEGEDPFEPTPMSFRLTRLLKWSYAHFEDLVGRMPESEEALHSLSLIGKARAMLLFVRTLPYALIMFGILWLRPSITEEMIAIEETK